MVNERTTSVAATTDMSDNNIAAMRDIRECSPGDGSSGNLSIETGGKRMARYNNQDKDLKPSAEKYRDDSRHDENNATIDDDDDDDNEGLHRRYDVVLIGTGLIQSILAASLARAGKTILHCDAADHYGELEAVWTLGYVKQQQQEQQRQQQQERQPDGITKQQRSENTLSTEPEFATSDDACSPIRTIALHPAGLVKSNLQFLSCHTKTNFPWTVGMAVQTLYGQGTIIQLPSQPDLMCNSSVSIELNQWTLDNGSHPILYVGIPEDVIAAAAADNREATANAIGTYLSKASSNTVKSSSSDDQKRTGQPWYVRTNKAKNGIYPIAQVEAEQILHHQSRSLALDVQPGLLYASGAAVDGLITSQVADYLEFKAVECLLYYHQGQFQRVPCNKNDVFASSSSGNVRLFCNVMEKRRLMKFLQLVMDYATASASATSPDDRATSSSNDIEEFSGPSSQGSTLLAVSTPGNSESATTGTTTIIHEPVTSLNERHLLQGRSLARPQNKTVEVDALQRLQELVTTRTGRFQPVTCLAAYLQESEHALSDHLQSLITHAMALEVQPAALVSASIGIQHLAEHLQALGRYGTTGFLVPVYGSGELAQAFCRSAAVYGATYLLRRAVTTIQIQSIQNNENQITINPGTEKAKVHSVMLNPVQADEHDDTNDTNASDNRDGIANRSEKRIRCTHVICSRGAAIEPAAVPNDIPANACSVVLRRISILRGKPLQEGGAVIPQQRHVVIFPPGSISTRQPCAIQGIVLDEHVRVTPYLGSTAACSIVHLTTLITSNNNEDNASIADCDILDQALQCILGQSQGAEEIFHVSFCFPLNKGCSQHDDPADDPAVSGLHWIDRSSVRPTVDGAFDQAARIFRTICPNDTFLDLSNQMQAMLQERLGEAHSTTLNERHEDEEQRALDSAMSIVTTSPSIS